jgi:hypothetical protein
MSISNSPAVNEATPTYLTVNQFVDHHIAFTLGGLRALIFNEQTNKLKESKAIVRIGRKVLINEPKFFMWLENQNK